MWGWLCVGLVFCCCLDFVGVFEFAFDILLYSLILWVIMVYFKFWLFFV